MRHDSPPRVIHLHAAAPAKPPEGQPCNGCGLCCAFAPCPMGALISRRRTGACKALEWQTANARYRCGVLSSPKRWVPWLPTALTRKLARRWIAASTGCDSSLERA
jgi:hypothetical protein